MESKKQPMLVVAALCRHEGRVLVLRRKAGLSHAGLWELPGGKVEVGESLREALVREIREELGVDCETDNLVGIGHSNNPDQPITLVALEAILLREPKQSTDHDEMKWIGPEDLASLPLGVADLEILSQNLRGESELLRVNMGTAVKVSVLAHMVVGFIVATLPFVIPLPDEYRMLRQAGWMAFIFVPLMYGIAGAFVGAVAASIYNGFAKTAGGLRMTWG